MTTHIAANIIFLDAEHENLLQIPIYYLKRIEKGDLSGAEVTVKPLCPLGTTIQKVI
tara:strand:- start:137 stop:307 length:171 start_codon:yes stop_codon:yes gene_type:complete